jgi:AcrR family transcriptional regulator
MTNRTKGHQDDPKQRLLKAGEELFAEVGYHHATIRDISRRANVNIAMINYYFGGKAPLYRAVLEHSLGQSMRKSAPSREMPSGASAEERLHGFVLALLSHALDEGGASLNEQLMARELTEPTFALSTVVDKVIRPRAEQGHALVRRLLGDQATDDEIHRTEQSIVAQCLHYRHNRPIVERLYPGQTFGPEEITRLARHITRFSLAAILAYRRCDAARPAQVRRSPEDPPAVSPPPVHGPIRSRAHAGDAKVRLLEAALELFALVGFRHVTIREICRRADVNIAMVNYYFGGKEDLYKAVLEHALRGAPSQSPSGHCADHHGLEKRLEAFVFSLLSHVLDEERSPWSKRLIAREMAEPTFALEILVNRVVRPRSEELHAIVRGFLGSSASDIDIQWSAESIAAQCLYYQYNRPVLELLFPSERYGPAETRQLAEHITRFSLAALQTFSPSNVN